MTVGRRRKDGNPLKLEPRVYPKNGQWQYRHRNGDWEKLGTDVAKANARARVYNDPEHRAGTIGYFLDLLIAEAKAGRLHKKKAQRTIDDYEECAPYLKLVFDKMVPGDLVERPSLIAEYRKNRSIKAPVRANREMSLLSSMYSWLIESADHCPPGLTTNPVLSIARNTERAKDRYVEDDELRAVYGIAQRSVCMAMDTIYQTLQRPADALSWGPESIRVKQVGGTSLRVLSARQGKRGRTVDIEVTPELEATLRMLSGGKVARHSDYLVHTLDGEAYTVEGIGAMLRRYCKRAGVKTFGLMDLRAKGATDMYLRGVPLEVIQMLMAHKSKVTTEIYIKRIMQTIRTALPNTPVASASGRE